MLWPRFEFLPTGRQSMTPCVTDNYFESFHFMKYLANVLQDCKMLREILWVFLCLFGFRNNLHILDILL